MNKKQMNRKHMLEASLTYLDMHIDIWQSVPKIVDVKTQLTEVDQAIDAAAMDQQQSQVYIGKIKLELKRTLSEKADILNDLLEVYALMTGNEVLAQAMNKSVSELFEMSYDNLLRYVKITIDAAVEHKEPLTAEYGLTTEQLESIQGDYDRMMELNGQPREYQIRSGVASLTLEELFTRASDLLSNQLDNLMKLFKRRDPNFYNGYLKARMIVDY